MAELTGDENGLAAVKISEETEESLEIPPELQKAVKQLQQYFEGKRQHFDLKLQPKGTDFQQKVWKELLKIPFGNTTSYLELSRKLGDVKAIRAVAAANGKKSFMDHCSLPPGNWQRWKPDGLRGRTASQKMATGF